MLLNRRSLPPEREDAFTSVAIAACIDGQNLLKMKLLSLFQQHSRASSRAQSHLHLGSRSSLNLK